MNRKDQHKGFTLIEVLLALAIIAIAFTALLKTTGENISQTRRLTEKTIAHWVALQGITMVQLGLINPPTNETMTKVTRLFGQRIFWRVHLSSTPFKGVQHITITVAQKQTGPFMNPLTGYRYANPSSSLLSNH